jgi:hypothetical protein
LRRAEQNSSAFVVDDLSRTAVQTLHSHGQQYVVIVDPGPTLLLAPIAAKIKTKKKKGKLFLDRISRNSQ